MNKQSTSAKFARPVTGIVMEYLTTWSQKSFNIYISLLCIVAVLSPFMHLIFLIEDKEGVFGYSYMSSFLFSLSLPLMSISSGLLLKFASVHISDMFKSSFKLIGNAFIFIGFFFLIYTFVPVYDFTVEIYFGALLVLSVVLTILAHFLHKAAITTEERLKGIISKLFDFIILETPRKHVPEEKQIDYVISYEKVLNDIGEE